MVKAKQKNLRVFDIEIGEEAEFLAYIEKNALLLKEYLLVLSGSLSDEGAAFLNARDLCFIAKHNCKGSGFKARESTPKAVKIEEMPEKKANDDSANRTLVYNRPIRSGEEIETEGDVVIFNRVNSGAKIRAQGNIQIFGEVDGIIECEGDFMLLRKLNMGHVVFGGEILDKTLFSGPLKKIVKKSDRISVEEF